MIRSGMFFGIGVGPGEPGLIPVAAWDTSEKVSCDLCSSGQDHGSFGCTSLLADGRDSARSVSRN